jgi:uncharacterized protein (TIGR03084 family)
MDAVVRALAGQQAELAGVLDGITEAGWRARTRCEGWGVSDVVLHLAQTDEMAIASATGRFTEVAAQLSQAIGGSGSIDEGAASWVERERGQTKSEVLNRWSSGAERLLGVFDTMDMSTRVTWVAGEMAARTLATTRLAETWVHTVDVADALGTDVPNTERLEPIARLAWRTLPYAFATAGRTMAGPVAFRLVSPNGDFWDLVPDDPPMTTISGPAAELCAVATRRVDPAVTTLRGEGPDADAVLSLVRTYAS